MIESLKCTQVVVAGGKKTSANTHYRCQHLSYRFNLRPATRHHPRNKTQTGRDEAEPVLDTEFRAVRQPSTFYPLIHPQLAHLLSTRPSTLYSLIHPLLAHPPSTQGREGGRKEGRKGGRECSFWHALCWHVCARSFRRCAAGSDTSPFVIQVKAYLASHS